MKSKEDLTLEDLPDDTLGVMDSFLNHEDRQKVITVSSSFHSIFKDNYRFGCLLEHVATGNQKKATAFLDHYPYLLNDPIRLKSYLLACLLRFVATGKQTEAEEIIKAQPELLTMSGITTDLSKRRFINIFPLQLAIYNWDVYMANMILDYLPNIKNGEQFRIQLLNQYKSIQQDGITYQLKNKIVIEKSFDMQPLLSAFQDCLDVYDNYDRTKYRDLWIIVGQQQTFLPAFIRQLYGQLDFFRYCDFDHLKFDRSSQFCTWMKNKGENICYFWTWDDSHPEIDVKYGILSDIGVKYGILSMRPCACQGLATEPSTESLSTELNGLKTLNSKIIKKLELLEEKLNQPLQSVEQKNRLCL